MNSQEIRDLHEAYLNVYKLDEEDYDRLKDRRLASGGAFSGGDDPEPKQRNRPTTPAKKLTPEQQRKNSGDAFAAVISQWKKQHGDASISSGSRTRKPASQNEQVELYDVILSHLLDEGYAETPEAAEKIMVSMSEEWREYIIEAEREFPLRKVADKINQVSDKIKSSKSPEETSKLRKRMDKMNDEYWKPN